MSDKGHACDNVKCKAYAKALEDSSETIYKYNFYEIWEYCLQENMEENKLRKNSTIFCKDLVTAHLLIEEWIAKYVNLLYYLPREENINKIEFDALPNRKINNKLVSLCLIAEAFVKYLIYFNNEWCQLEDRMERYDELDILLKDKGLEIGPLYYISELGFKYIFGY